MRRLQINIFLTVAMATALSCVANVNVRVHSLRCEQLTDPVGIGLTTPRLGWKLSSDDRGVVQTAWYVEAASSPEKLASGKPDMWVSGRVKGGALQAVYEGKALKKGDRIHWRVRVSTPAGESAWSEPACFSVGIVDPADWKADWIGLEKLFPGESDTTARPVLAARYLRREFDAPRKAVRATAYICGLGLYELHINGKKVGDQVLAPLCSQFEQRAYYNTFEVGDMLTEGRNAIGVILGNGRFYSRRMAMTTSPQTRHYGFPKMLFQLEVEYEDGGRELITSDASWRVSPFGPIRANNEYDGETYDSRMELPGWDRPDYREPAGKWMAVEVTDSPTQRVVAQMSPPMRVTQVIKPVAVRKVKDAWVFDMGQNMVGWARLWCKAPAAREQFAERRITLRFAERVNDDGSINLANIRDARVTDTYIMNNWGTESFEPRFVYHGFRYVELKGWPAGQPTVDDLDGMVIHDDLEPTGKFECSNEILNTVYRNAVWGIRGNYNGMPTDCPQRDERMGWLGDRTAGSLGESFIYNIDPLYAKWLQDIEDSQSPGGSLPNLSPSYWNFYEDNVTWPAAFIFCADMLRRQYGDRRPIELHYDAMKRWMDYMRDRYMKDGIIEKDRYGDWCVPPEDPTLIHSQDPDRKTDGFYIGSVYYVQLLRYMSGFSKMLGRGDETRFDELAVRMKEAVNMRFYDPDKGYYVNGTATSSLIALWFDIVPEQGRARLMDRLVEQITVKDKNHVGVGLIGIQMLMRTLSDNGRIDLAWKLATNTTYPSWGYMAGKGATTIWELWNGDTADIRMNSGNHVMLLGDLITWFYEYLAGIRTVDEGFSQIELRPCPVGNLKWASASFDSRSGLIISDWKLSDGRFEWRAEIPAGTSARIFLPCADPETVTESDKPLSQSKTIKIVKFADGRLELLAGSGSYDFASANQ